MKYHISGHDRNTAVMDMLICLFPDESHEKVAEAELADVLSCVFENENRLISEVRVSRNGLVNTAQESAPVPSSDDYVRTVSYIVKTALFKAVSPFLNEKPNWGSITGVKPAKAARLALESGMSAAQAEKWMQEHYFVDEHRSRLSVTSAEVASNIKKRLTDEDVGLYVGIPFCPTRCSYCSFVSSTVSRSGKLLPSYLEALMRELESTAEGIMRAGKKVTSLYVGGGTPTILDEIQLSSLLEKIHNTFDLSACREITLEAGRPDTITAEKLHIISSYGIKRICINPQTLIDSVLEKAGRPHTADDIIRCYEMARREGDFIINMDLIAGLPGDDAEGLFKSVRGVIDLAPENITIHSMALKKGASIRFGERGVLDAVTLDACHKMVADAGYSPYYMYKQKYSAGGLENVGFTLPGAVSEYNVVMMEELSTVISAGAGAVSKIVGDDGRAIARHSNPKYAAEYIAAIDAICEKKANFCGTIANNIDKSSDL